MTAARRLFDAVAGGRSFLSGALLAVCVCAGAAAASPDGQNQIQLHAVPASEGGAAINFRLAEGGQISLAVYDSAGRLLRTLLSGRPLTAGNHAVKWDGLDRDGIPAPPGDYQVRMLSTDGLRSELIANVGINPEPFWEMGVGNHDCPSAVTADSQGMMLVPSVNEGGYVIARMGYDRRYQWAGLGDNARTFDFMQQGRTPRLPHGLHWGYMPCAAATIDDRVLVLSNDGTLHEIDSVTGQRLRASPREAWSVRWPGGDKTEEGGVHVPLTYLDMDAADGIVAVSYRRHDAIRWYDPQTREMIAETTDIAEPLGVAVENRDTLLVISQGAVWRVSRSGKRQRLIAAEQLTGGWRLSLDRRTNQLLVAENGVAAGEPRPGHQVKRFDLQGRLIATYGRAGGRRDGVYVPTDFREITDIAADGEGGFVVAEPRAAPRRVARFDGTGRVLMESFGSVPYATSATPEPDNPRMVWYGGGGLVRAEIDPAANSWRVREVYVDAIEDNPLAAAGGYGQQVYRRDGHTYIVTFRNTMLLHDAKAATLRPVFAMGWAARDIQLNKDPQSRGWYLPENLRPAENPTYRITTGYLWSDLNEDGLPTVEEIQLFDEYGAKLRTSGKIAFLEDDLSLVLQSAYSSATRLPVNRVTPGGTPVYDPGAVESLPFGMANGLYRDRKGFWWHSTRGRLRGERHGIGWWPGLVGTDRLTKYDAAGNEVWSVGRHNALWDSEPGWSHGLEGIAGEVRDCIVVDGNFVDTESVGPMAWTQDGLFVDQLLVNPGGTYPEFVYYGSRSEMPRGTVIEDPISGEVWFFAHGNSSAPVFRIDGWNDWSRAEAAFTLTHTASAAGGEGTGLQAEYFATPDWSGTPAVTRIDEQVFFDWIKSPVEGLPPRQFSARWKGAIEAPVDETFRIVLRAGSNQRNRDESPVVRMWVNDEKVIDSPELLGMEPRNYTREYWTATVPMKAGRRYAVRIEYADRGHGWKQPQGGGYNDVDGTQDNYLHLCWESPTIERQSIESKYLFPDPMLADTDGVATPEGDPRLAGRVLPVVSDQPQTVADNGLIAHFRFDEKDGHLASSDIGAGLRASVHGDTAWTEGHDAGGLRFEGGNAFVDAELRLPHTDYTISFWFKTDSASGRLLSVNRRPTFQNNFHENRLTLADGKVSLWFANESNSTAKPYNDGGWHHLVMTVAAGAGHTVAIDGEPVIRGKADRMGLWHLWHVPTEKLGLRVGPGDGTSIVTIDDLEVRWTAHISPSAF